MLSEAGVITSGSWSGDGRSVMSVKRPRSAQPATDRCVHLDRNAGTPRQGAHRIIGPEQHVHRAKASSLLQEAHVA